MLHAAVLQRQYAAAARAIRGADFLLIGAGAGMGVDAGLAAYADVATVPAWASRGHDYASLCDPALLEEDPALFYGFWGHCYNRYMDAEPHAGYGTQSHQFVVYPARISEVPYSVSITFIRHWQVF
eukprot:COSAG01_NODE_1009_length_12151_cov_18.810571_1_plen_126_part_00